jgi:hypothetical protein
MILCSARFEEASVNDRRQLTFHGTKYVELAPDVVLGGPGLNMVQDRIKIYAT